MDEEQKEALEIEWSDAFLKRRDLIAQVDQIPIWMGNFRGEISSTDESLQAFLIELQQIDRDGGALQESHYLQLQQSLPILTEQNHELQARVDLSAELCELKGEYETFVSYIDRFKALPEPLNQRPEEVEFLLEYSEGVRKDLNKRKLPDNISGKVVNCQMRLAEQNLKLEGYFDYIETGHYTLLTDFDLSNPENSEEFVFPDSKMPPARHFAYSRRSPEERDRAKADAPLPMAFTNPPKPDPINEVISGIADKAEGFVDKHGDAIDQKIESAQDTAIDIALEHGPKVIEGVGHVYDVVDAVSDKLTKDDGTQVVSTNPDQTAVGSLDEEDEVE